MHFALVVPVTQEPLLPSSELAPNTVSFDPSTILFGSMYGSSSSEVMDFSSLAHCDTLSGNLWFSQNASDVEMTDALFRELSTSEMKLSLPSTSSMLRT